MISAAERILNRVSCPIADVADVADECAADFASVSEVWICWWARTGEANGTHGVVFVAFD
jgi:hypothetical protein